MVLIFLASPKIVFADEGSCFDEILGFSTNGWPPVTAKGISLVPPAINVNFFGLFPGGQYEARCQHRDGSNPLDIKYENLFSSGFTANSSGNGIWTLDNNKCWSVEGDHKVILIRKSTSGSCRAFEYKVEKQSKGLLCTEKIITDKDGNPGCFEENGQINWKFTIMNGSEPYDGKIIVTATNVENGLSASSRNYQVRNGNIEGTDKIISAGKSVSFHLYKDNLSNKVSSCDFETTKVQGEAECTKEEKEKDPDETKFKEGGIVDFDLCSQIPDATLKGKCNTCRTSSNGIWTAVGCIRTDAQSIVSAILEVGLSVAGGVALLMFLAASFMLSTSQGEPKRTSDAKEMVTSAIIGLLFIVFSVIILQFIGADILKIPGFGG